mmetsp:Transcript_9988/g.16706  ORF Transcript_9988/g.16706 Transcript_9988/m.16706 type:complete len:323 (-) Transcript_9988:107-1075(-)
MLGSALLRTTSCSKGTDVKGGLATVCGSVEAIPVVLLFLLLLLLLLLAETFVCWSKSLFRAPISNEDGSRVGAPALSPPPNTFAKSAIMVFAASAFISSAVAATTLPNSLSMLLSMLSIKAYSFLLGPLRIGCCTSTSADVADSHGSICFLGCSSRCCFVEVALVAASDISSGFNNEGDTPGGATEATGAAGGFGAPTSWINGLLLRVLPVAFPFCCSFCCSCVFNVSCCFRLSPSVNAISTTGFLRADACPVLSMSSLSADPPPAMLSAALSFWSWSKSDEVLPKALFSFALSPPAVLPVVGSITAGTGFPSLSTKNSMGV